MTPAEHYAEAERLLGKIGDIPTTRGDGRELPWEVTASSIENLLAHAQVHATLAAVENKTFRKTTPLGELTDKELRVLRDAVQDVKRIRPAGSLRSQLLESVGSKLGLWDKTVQVTPADIDKEDS